MADPVAEDLAVFSGTGNEVDSLPKGANGEVVKIVAGAVVYDNVAISEVPDLQDKLDLNSSSSSTMFVKGYGMSINADDTKVDIALGEGIHVDYWTTPGIPPVVTQITFGGLTAVSITDITLGPATWLAVKYDNTVSQRSAAQGMHTPEEMRDIIAQVLVIHTLGVVTGFGPAHSLGLSLASTVRDMADYAGLIAKGFEYGAGTLSTSINKGAGSYFFPMGNWVANPTVSQMKSLNTPSAPAVENISYVTVMRDGSGGFDFSGESTPTFNEFDDGDGTLGTVSTNAWSVRVIYLASDTVTTVIQFGQFAYNNVETAILSIGSIIPIRAPDIREDTVRCWMVLRGGGSDTDDVADCIFLQADRFGLAPRAV